MKSFSCVKILLTVYCYQSLCYCQDMGDSPVGPPVHAPGEDVPGEYPLPVKGDPRGDKAGPQYAPGEQPTHHLPGQSPSPGRGAKGDQGMDRQCRSMIINNNYGDGGLGDRERGPPSSDFVDRIAELETLINQIADSVDMDALVGQLVPQIVSSVTGTVTDEVRSTIHAEVLTNVTGNIHELVSTQIDDFINSFGIAQITAVLARMVEEQVGESIHGIIEEQLRGRVAAYDFTSIIESIDLTEIIYPSTVRDCSDAITEQRTSGVYNIRPEGATRDYSVYCEVDGNDVFTHIQHRADGSVNFARNWVEYTNGFGNIAADGSGSFYIGNMLIHLITSQRQYSLVVELEIDGSVTSGSYYDYKLGSGEEGFRLGVHGFTDTFFNFVDRLTDNNGAMFSTFDRDNDGLRSGSCSHTHGQSGWWFSACGESNLNGVYHSADQPVTDNTGIFWKPQEATRNPYSYLRATMKIKPTF